ncbi:MAG: ribosome-associated translation inhibitor RaiA [Candidatus Eisenbacteria bacterium]|nr:ribosome-associated translation inhibitor RaiA [Candidatus Eisenbacteria bacterium]
MRIIITCRHCEMDPDLKDYVEDKVSRLARYFDRVDEAHVVFEAEGHRRIAGVTVHASRAVISSEQTADDMRSAFDRSMEKVERQIRRYKGRVRNHKGVEPTADVAAQAGGVALESLGIVPESLASKSMTAAEAFSELEELGVAFLVFVNTETDRISVIYRRGDGDYGLVEPAE